ncbi:hypothetical protein [Puniceicoccus vermicola]|uniref:Lipoprotein n=1 Tax=Puniceicoccus vermicola TaxID=388746 RepID=A0A7X1AZX8_9BACT|nr:hypothetical protein [Puniceicoccus vermicola]MBC2603014.1 hypothetical protein [Puniceicoccus vermicola]
MLYPPPILTILTRSFALLAFLCLAGCGPSGPREVRNDDYEKPAEPDYALRQFLDIQTLRAEFEMPADMKTFRVGMIYIENGQVTASEWLSGDGLHTVHADGKREYAKTLLAEFMVGESDGEWKTRLHVTPRFTGARRKPNLDFWERFEEGDLRIRGWSDQMQNDKLGNFRVLAASYGTIGNVTIGPVERLLRDMDFLALLVVDFLPEEMDPSEGPVVYPSEEELQAVVVEEVGGVR